MKNIEIYPLVILYGYRRGDDIIFIDRKEDITIVGGYNLISDVLQYCNGLNSLREIRAKISPGNKSSFVEVIDFLFENDIVCDSRKVYQQFHEDSANPTLYSYNWSTVDIVELEKLPKHVNPIANGKEISLDKVNSDLLDLVRKRHSTRCFKKGEMTESTLSGLLESIYSTGETRSVPSAGGLYPLDIYIAVMQDIQDIERGWYQYDSLNHRLIQLTIDSSIERVYQLLDCSCVLENALLTIFIAGDLERTTHKYANRGYRFIMIEAGHAAQNANLYCLENGLGAVEWGGFQDNETSKTLGLDYPNQSVLLGMVIGIEDEEKRQILSDPYVDRMEDLKKKVIGKGKIVRWVSIKEYCHDNYTMPRFTASAQFVKRGERGSGVKYTGKSFATGLTTAEASLKATIEAIERYSCGISRVDKIAKAVDMDESDFLDPYLIAPFNEEQCSLLNIEPFKYDTDWQWIFGKRMSTGKEISIPIDLVFYPLRSNVLGRNLCYLANSSGVSAHYDYEKAVENALFELIERDAIAVTWLTQRKVTAIPTEFASDEIRDRIKFWQKQGRKIKLLNLTIDSLPVVMTIFDSPIYPCIVAGAATALTFDEAITKSFNEAEFMLLSWEKARPRKISDPTQVTSVSHHGIYYFYPGHQNELGWLLEAEIKEITPLSNIDIYRQFDPIVLDITPAEVKCGISVVRVMSETLMPIGFGYGSEHYRHSRIDMLHLERIRDYPGSPHLFA